MYSLETPLSVIKGVGPKLAEIFAGRQLYTVKDLLLFVPLRYEDRSTMITIRQLLDSQTNELVTLQARVHSTGNYYKGRRSIQSATVSDETGKLKLMWFNNHFIIEKLKVGQEYLISGKLNDRRIMVQAVVEDVKDDTIHTGRLVPIYSNVTTIKQGTLRRLLKHILDNLNPIPDPLAHYTAEFQPLLACVTALHFPDTEDHVVQARERLALEELLSLMEKSRQIKDEWSRGKKALEVQLPIAPTVAIKKLIPATVPFELTPAQLRATTEILSDLQQSIPMNRLLIGDVGSGKTVVAGTAGVHVLANGHSVALIAPTRILAEQHAETIKKLFPNVEMELISAGTKKTKRPLADQATAPTFYIGTHALINRLADIKPGLVIYDEQHRFGVSQRSAAEAFLATASTTNQTSNSDAPPTYFPHILTMTATPIPRSLMLTIFSHLSLSLIDEMPAGRVPVKTWLVPESKRADSYTWVSDQLAGAKMSGHSNQALVICPFIDPSNSLALENVAAVKDTFVEIKKAFPQASVELLHGRLKKTEQTEITQRLFNREIEILVTTPIVEVGVDLPAASMIIIEAAERFGLASLHQLRGRVGRAGQQAYCLLFTSSKSDSTKDRLTKFTQITNGHQLAELDLQHRGAGDIFGTQQHGFDDLQFASWANVELISQARSLFATLEADPTWQPFLSLKTKTEAPTPLAN